MFLNYIKSTGIDPHSHDGRILVEECVLYLAGVTDAFDFQRAVKAIDLKPTGMSGKDYRLKLQETSYLTLNLKYAALFVGLSPNNADTYIKLQKFLTATDVTEFKQLFSKRKFKSRVRDSAKQRELTLNDVTYAAMRKHKAQFTLHINKIGQHIKRKTYQKLRFLVKAENAILRDYHSDVMCKVLRAYYKLVPTKQPDEYVLNYMRQAATRHVLNIIESAKTDKRNRMEKIATSSDGLTVEYGLICESESQHKGSFTSEKNADVEYNYENLDNSISASNAVKVEDEIMLDRLKARYDGRKRKAVEILAGEYHEKFTVYLRRKGIIKKEDDDHHDYQRRVSHKTYLNTVADYLGVVREAFMKFVSRLGTIITQHKEFA